MSNIQTGTGDGGMTPGRKVKSFLWLVVSVLICVYTTTAISAPNDVAIQALWIIGMGGLFTIGGQSLVDSVEKWASSRSSVSTQQVTNISEVRKSNDSSGA